GREASDQGVNGRAGARRDGRAGLDRRVGADGPARVRVRWPVVDPAPRRPGAVASELLLPGEVVGGRPHPRLEPLLDGWGSLRGRPTVRMDVSPGDGPVHRLSVRTRAGPVHRVAAIAGGGWALCIPPR